MKRKALLKDKWDYLGKLSDKKNAAIYQSCEMTGKIDDQTYRFIVIKSDKKDKRKLKTLDRAVKREHTTLAKTLEELKKRPFACKHDAEIEVKKFIKENDTKYHITDWIIEEKIENVKREKRGRPKNNDKIQTQTNYYLNGNLQLDDKAYEMDRAICGLFVLITSLMDLEKSPSKKILQRYKGQGNVERIFKFIKNPAWVGSFCLNTPSRIAALGYMVLMAAMIYALWERNIRKALSKSKEEPIEGLNRQKTRKPTTYALQKVMSSILVLSQITNGKIESIWLPKPLKPNQEHILQLTGFSKEIYTYTSKV